MDEQLDTLELDEEDYDFEEPSSTEERTWRRSDGQIPCERCNGVGSFDNTDGTLDYCEDCNGSGYVNE